MAAPFIYNASVVRVVDGDTIVLDLDLGMHIRKQEHVRLIDVNAPEVFGSHASQAGRDAREFTRLWCELNPQVVFESVRYDQREKYGRLLGIVRSVARPEVTLNAALLLWLTEQT